MSEPWVCLCGVKRRGKSCSACLARKPEPKRVLSRFMARLLCLRFRQACPHRGIA